MQGACITLHGTMHMHVGPGPIPKKSCGIMGSGIALKECMHAAHTIIIIIGIEEINYCILTSGIGIGILHYPFSTQRCSNDYVTIVSFYSTNGPIN